MIACLKHLKNKQLEVHKENDALAAHDVLCKEMVTEMSVHDNRPNVEKLQSYLNETRDIRTETCKKKDAGLIFQTYPALKVKELVSFIFFISI